MTREQLRDQFLRALVEVPGYDLVSYNPKGGYEDDESYLAGLLDAALFMGVGTMTNRLSTFLVGMSSILATIPPDERAERLERYLGAMEDLLKQ